MGASAFTTSRRTLLTALTAASVAPWPSICVGDATAGTLTLAPPIEPISLRRSGEGRSLSRTRYHNAEGFFVGVDTGGRHHRHDQLYQIGIVIQLGLSSHLLDVGFDDAWCARHVGLNVAKSLAYANATGLGLDCPKLEHLAAILSPYGKWRHADLAHPTDDCPFSEREVRQLTRMLLERVREVTGHARPRGWRRRLL